MDQLGILPHRGRSGVAAHGMEVLLMKKLVD